MSMSRQGKPRIVIAGQLPPPFGGQNINTARVLDLLKGSDAYEVLHLRLEFSKGVRSFRRFDWGKILELFRVAVRLLRIRRKGKVDLLLFSTGGPHLMPILRDILVLPLIVLFSRRVWVQFQAGGIAQKIESLPWVIQKALVLAHTGVQGAIVATNWGRADPESVGIDRIEVIPHGLEDYGCRIGGEAPNSQILLNLGHLSEVKGTPQLVAAFGQLASSYPNLRLRLVGEFADEYTEEILIAEAKKFGVEDRIDLVGLVKGAALFDEYKRSDLFVFSSVAHESFGMVMVEAMMCGLPVVALDWRGNREVLTEGFGGVIAPFEASRMEVGLKAGLEKALKEEGKWQEWGERNREIYLKNYTLLRLKENWISFFGEHLDELPENDGVATIEG